jgi:hypothetical protein
VGEVMREVEGLAEEKREWEGKGKAGRWGGC